MFTSLVFVGVLTIALPAQAISPGGMNGIGRIVMLLLITCAGAFFAAMGAASFWKNKGWPELLLAGFTAGGAALLLCCLLAGFWFDVPSQSPAITAVAWFVQAVVPAGIASLLGCLSALLAHALVRWLKTRRQ